MGTIEINQFITPDPKWPYHPLSKCVCLYFAMFQTDAELSKASAAILSAGDFNVARGQYAMTVYNIEGYPKQYYTDQLPGHVLDILKDYLVDLQAQAMEAIKKEMKEHQLLPI